MDVGAVRLSDNERTKRRTLGLLSILWKAESTPAFLSGSARKLSGLMGDRGAPSGHAVLNPPQGRLVVPKSLSWNECCFTVAFIDSGAGGVFLKAALVKSFQIPTVLKDPPLCVTTLSDGLITHKSKPLSILVGALHFEVLFSSPKYPVILRFPWLCKHNPSGQVSDWSTSCHVNCLQKVVREWPFIW